MANDLFMVNELDNTMISIATHDGVFHADEVLATAMFLLSTEQNVQMVRSRNKDIYANADLVFDLGLDYSPEKGRYDHHHEAGGVMSQRFGFEDCATAGLVWDWFGPAVVVKHFQNTPSLVEGIDLADIVREVHERFISDIDAIDTGNRRPEKGEYTFSHAVSSFNPTGDGNRDVAFRQAVMWVMPVIGTEINKAVARLRDREYLSSVFKDAEKVAVFDRYPEGWQELCPENIERVIFPRIGGGYTVQKPAGRSDLVSQEEALELLGDELIFVHAARFVGAAKTLPGAITLAWANISGTTEQTP